MKPGDAFFVIQCFDEQGYHSSALAPTLAECRELASKKRHKTFVAMSAPFGGRWSPSGIPDVSLPDDFKSVLAAVDKNVDDR
jgi:hypothetical protein